MRLATTYWDLEQSRTPAITGSLDSQSTLLLAFGSAPALGTANAVHELARRFPHSTIAGCSTAGEVYGHTLRDGGFSVAVACFESTTLRSASAAVKDSSDSFEAGIQLARVVAAPDLRAVLVISDGINVNGSALVRGLESKLPSRPVVLGGLAGDGDRFDETWVIVEGEAQPGYVMAVGLYGEAIRVGHGSQGGWDAFGPQRIVTRSDGNILYELDGKPALELYKHYLGDLVADLPASALLFPLALRERPERGSSLVRTILAVDDDKNSMTFAGDIPEGWTVQLMRATFDRLIEGASLAGRETACSTDGHGPYLGFAVSCVGRRLVLGERAEDELEAVCEELPRDTQLVGFYSYGEISPHASGRCELHNQTMTVATIGEST